ncbi:DUF3054 domain-containing protein [Natronorubrum daqingense]|uniref:DUF3054 domain-containing protein n=1 Tax=Natronorubrum daqingense TaxID=588898 RepID=A0A1N7DND4_9EURY|nr:DUF3054 domain-containing protein [Natronorubrum daqingense]APX96079.1 hypothetical protein BB347_05295 [Natronorubrum daqingense]SIR77359.1 Protein of unknown function [Natronorubrum daqingense]
MESATRLSTRVGSADRRTFTLVAGDLLVLTALVLVGQLEHGMNPLEQPIGALEALAPFVVGWIVVAALAGLYTRPISTSLWETTRLTTVAWLAAANVGLVLRQSVFGSTAAWPFPLVISAFGLVLLVGWRVGFAYVSSSTDT